MQPYIWSREFAHQERNKWGTSADKIAANLSSGWLTSFQRERPVASGEKRGDCEEERCVRIKKGRTLGGRDTRLEPNLLIEIFNRAKKLARTSANLFSFKLKLSGDTTISQNIHCWLSTNNLKMFSKLFTDCWQSRVWKWMSHAERDSGEQSHS